MPRLLIAVRSAVFAAAIQNRLQQQYDIAICTDGCQALNCLVALRPDCLILDLMLPQKDGLNVLREAAYLPSVILAITDYVTPYVQQEAVALGVWHMLLMPTVHAVSTTLLNMQPVTRKQDITGQVIFHLQALDFQSHLDGYAQLCIGIPMYAADPSQKLGQTLYPAIAAKLDVCDGRNVEHSIRTAIRAAWMRKDPAVWAKYFPPDSAGRIPCPSNKRFMTRILQFIE